MWQALRGPPEPPLRGTAHAQEASDAEMGGTGVPAQQQPGSLGSWWEQMAAAAATLSPGQYLQRVFWGLPREERPGVRKSLESVLQVRVRAVAVGGVEGVASQGAHSACRLSSPC